MTDKELVNKAWTISGAMRPDADLSEVRMMGRQRYVILHDKYQVFGIWLVTKNNGLRRKPIPWFWSSEPMFLD